MDLTKCVSSFEIYNKNKKSPQPQKSKKRNKPVQNVEIKKKKKQKNSAKVQIKKNLHSKGIDNENKVNLINLSKSSVPRKPQNNNRYIEKSQKPSSKPNNPVVVTESKETPPDTPNTADKPSFDPIQESEKLFEWIIYPLKKDEFFAKYWEKKPLHIRRNKPRYFKSLMSTPMIDQILRENFILYTKNLDITSYANDVRETHNPAGRAMPSVVWDYYLNGCSVRMLNPQTYVPKLHALNATLQEFFGCFVGANSYLTPPESQGFAPHYDDIEAFILQIEGRKRWRLYRPRTDNEFLPRHSSANFSQKEIGEPVLDVVVNAGDLLYLPRGTIHQGDTIDSDKHSLHVTMSVYQRNSWGDLLEKLLPMALKDAIDNDVHFRKGLPLNYLRHLGLVHSNNNEARRQIADQTKFLLDIVLKKYIDLDRAADEMAKSHIHDFLPPVLNEDEAVCSIYEGGERMASDGEVVNKIEIEPDTRVRLCRGHCARLVEEEGAYQLYYSSDNSKEYHEYEVQSLEVDGEYVDAIRKLMVRFPRYTRVEDLPIGEAEKKMQMVQDLWERGVVVSEEPLGVIDE